MKLYLPAVILITLTSVFIFGCDDDTEDTTPNEIAWNESVDGELSGDLSSPTPVTFSEGNNKVIGSSTPFKDAFCTTFDGGPVDSIIPYFPGHENYVDAFTFTVPAGKSLVSILVEDVQLTEFHKVEDYPCIGPFESQAGAFVAMNASNQIDWNSNTVQEFIALPTEYPLIGIGFTRTPGDDLLSTFRAPFPSPGYEEVNDSNLTVGEGTYTFWWKEGQNESEYTLNFVIQ